MKGFILAILLLTTLAGCAKKAPDSTAATGKTQPVTDPNTFTYLALGDSYTIGQSVPQEQSFPYQLVARLNVDTKIGTPQIIARTGWTSANLIDAINKTGINGKTFDFVTLLIGVNDQYQQIDQATYHTNFVALLNTAIKFAGGNKLRVTVISIPDYSVTPSISGDSDATKARISREIDEFNAINKAESAKAGVSYQEITDISRLAATDQSLIAGDGLHPSGKMYALWVARLTPLIKSQLAK